MLYPLEEEDDGSGRIRAGIEKDPGFFVPLGEVLTGPELEEIPLLDEALPSIWAEERRHLWGFSWLDLELLTHD